MGEEKDLGTLGFRDSTSRTVTFGTPHTLCTPPKSIMPSRKTKKGHVNNMTASGNQLDTALSVRFEPREALKIIFFKLEEYCNDVKDRVYENSTGRDYTV